MSGISISQLLATRNFTISVLPRVEAMDTGVEWSWGRRQRDSDSRWYSESDVDVCTGRNQPLDTGKVIVLGCKIDSGRVTVLSGKGGGRW